MRLKNRFILSSSGSRLTLNSRPTYPSRTHCTRKRNKNPYLLIFRSPALPISSVSPKRTRAPLREISEMEHSIACPSSVYSMPPNSVRRRPCRRVQETRFSTAAISVSASSGGSVVGSYLPEFYRKWRRRPVMFATPPAKTPIPAPFAGFEAWTRDSLPMVNDLLMRANRAGTARHLSFVKILFKIKTLYPVFRKCYAAPVTEYKRKHGLGLNPCREAHRVERRARCKAGGQGWWRTNGAGTRDVRPETQGRIRDLGT